MTERPLAAIVLAAGQGKRMRAPVPKVLLEACGRTLVEHVLEALRPLGPRQIAVVYGHGGDAVPRALAERDLLFVHQERQLGTGDAVRCALPALGEFDGDILVLCGDTPLLTAAVLGELVADHRRAGRALTVLSAELEDPASLGRILRGPDGRLRAIREAADAAPEERAVREINTGVILAGRRHLEPALARLGRDNAQGEFYLTDVPGLLLQEGLGVEAHRSTDADAALGVNSPAELATAVRLLRLRAVDRLLAAGVRIEDPATASIDADVEVGEGSELRPFTFLGRGVRVGRGSTVGPFAHLGPGTVVGDGVLLGASVEVHDSTIEDGVRVPGPARLLRAAVGRNAFLGPGTWTTADGEGRVVIGEGAHVGAGSVLAAPVTVGERAHVAPGTLLRRGASVPAGEGQDA